MHADSNKTNLKKENSMDLIMNGKAMRRPAPNGTPHPIGLQIQ